VTTNSETTEAAASTPLTVPPGRGFTHTQIRREERGKWVTCEWFSPELQGFSRTIPVTDGQDLQPWILERFGSGRYRLAPLRGNTPGGQLAPFELVSVEHPQQAIRIGAPSAPLPAGPPVVSGSAPASTWGPPANQAPTWQQIQEMQERAAERERQASAERLAAIRADEDERRARREREDEERRRRDFEDSERRAGQDRARALSELEALRERHKLELERSRQEHEMMLKRMELERERDAPSADDFADALEAAEERILASVKSQPEPPRSELMQFLAPHMPTIVGALQGLAKAAQQAAARPPAAPPGPVVNFGSEPGPMG
jgi:hypothetical protein